MERGNLLSFLCHSDGLELAKMFHYMMSSRKMKLLKLYLSVGDSTQSQGTMDKHALYGPSKSLLNYKWYLRSSQFRMWRCYHDHDKACHLFLCNKKDLILTSCSTNIIFNKLTIYTRERDLHNVFMFYIVIHDIF